jgi:hypothetical protein
MQVGKIPISVFLCSFSWGKKREANKIASTLPSSVVLWLNKESSPVAAKILRLHILSSSSIIDA